MSEKNYDILPCYPKHIAFIMDGNGRWAKRQGKPRTFGHKNGCEAIVRVLNACVDFDIRYVSLYAFSTENWKRASEEVGYLMRLLHIYFKRYSKELLKRNCKLVVSGFRDNLPLDIKKTIEYAENLTKDCDGVILNICFNYGSKKELVKATKDICKEVIEGKINLEDINEDTISNHLFTKDMPDVDLLVRSSGEERISNFLLYQIAYAELIFEEKCWPEFDKDVVYECLKEFAKRNRRFGSA